MTMPTPPVVTSWRVTGSTERTEIGPDGTPVTGLKVSYSTGMGGTGSIFVPKGQDTVDNIRTLLAAAAARTDSINSLASDT